MHTRPAIRGHVGVHACSIVMRISSAGPASIEVRPNGANQPIRRDQLVRHAQYRSPSLRHAKMAMSA